MPVTSTRAAAPNSMVPPALPDRDSNSRSVSHSLHLNTAPSVQRITKLQPVQNRVEVLMVHIPKLSIQGKSRLAAEVGVSRSTISRLVNGRINPSYRLARGVTTALERLLGFPLDMRDVFSTDGTYLTPSGCGLCRCIGGCLPDRAYDPEGNLRPEWQGQRPGDWSMTRPTDIGPLAKTDTTPATANNFSSAISKSKIPNAKEVL
jgi:DNA-binding XRE family transcriptional regulator